MRRPSGIVLVLALALLAAPACGDAGGAASDTTASASAPGTCDPGDDPLSSGVLAHDGVDRAYNVTFPPGEAPFPVVLNLHGVSGTKDVQDAATRLPVTGREHGFVTVTPQTAPGELQWDLDPSGRDVAYLLELVDRATASPCVDGQRIFVAGFSNGGMMAALLGCLHPDRFAAVGAVSGLVALDACDGRTPAPLVAVHGTADPSVGYDGTMSSRVIDLVGYDQGPAVHDLVASWASARGCDERPEVSVWWPAVRAEHCDAAVLVSVVDGDHSWPGPSIGSPVDANEVLWSFFESRSVEG